MNEQENQETEPLPSGYRREVKTYVLRAGRMTAAQQKAYDELAPAWCIPFEEKKINFVDIFGNTNPIIVEIGFGMGDATVAIAEANPNINYLGICRVVFSPCLSHDFVSCHGLTLIFYEVF